MLSFNDVYFGYNSQKILEGVSFEIKQGEFCFLIGKSGAGKSTILQLIYMNIFPLAGFVQVADFSTESIKPRKLPLLRRKIGIIFQDFKILNDRNIFDNIAFVLEVTNTPRREIKQKVNDALNEVGLSHRRYSMASELSGGEKQRVAIARAIVNEPLLILADEPTGNLDPETSFEIVDILSKINKKGTAILFATHNYDIVKKVGGKILKLENGKINRAVFKQT